MPDGCQMIELSIRFGQCWPCICNRLS